MYHPDDLDQAIHARQQRYRHEAYLHRLPTRSLRQAVGWKLVQLGTALGGARAAQTHTGFQR